ncbi:LytTR family DNA-binding domain-containing protein [Reichenbachiella sp. MALMAid0571]|uniref:LytR/AlgR family response regulator transcription factor n=1 Tax=Reichenbachiella sp. MALMAid0571 TaxID=3143939 RepID=UPI0032E052F9
MNTRILTHTLFWTLTTLFLTIYFGRIANDYGQAFYFATFMLPVAMATSYFFNYYLVPQFLIKKKYLKFTLYFFYTLIFSLYLEMLVMVLSFIVLANYQYDKMNPLTVDIFPMTTILYLIVFAVAFIRTFRAFQNSQQSQKELLDLSKKNENLSITVKSNRESILIQLNDITHIESLADYVKIHTPDNLTMTKEKISKLQKELPSHFIRIHRSYIVNKNFIDSFSKEKIKINGFELPISRTYKKQVLELLGLDS